MGTLPVPVPPPFILGTLQETDGPIRLDECDAFLNESPVLGGPVRGQLCGWSRPVPHEPGRLDLTRGHATGQEELERAKALL